MASRPPTPGASLFWISCISSWNPGARPCTCLSTTSSMSFTSDVLVPPTRRTNPLTGMSSPLKLWQWTSTKARGAPQSSFFLKLACRHCADPAGAASFSTGTEGSRGCLSREHGVAKPHRYLDRHHPAGPIARLRSYVGRRWCRAAAMTDETAGLDSPGAGSASSHEGSHGVAAVATEPSKVTPASTTRLSRASS